jgi:putative aminopeptidase FrvX
MTAFVLDHIAQHSHGWKVQPKVLSGGDLEENIILVFGDSPRTAVFAHMDSIGFTVRYGWQLVRIGGPVLKDGLELVGSDSQGHVEARLKVKDGEATYRATRLIDRGTSLTFRPDFRLTRNHVQCCYLDNRLGVWVALRLAETLTDGIIVFSTREEHMGGAVSHMASIPYNRYGITQALISDITWVTEGVRPGKGVAISMRDSGLPRKKYVDRIIALARTSGIPFQLEVEGAGGSDGTELQRSPYPIQWCFIGAAEQHVHTPDEKVHLADIDSMLAMYRYLMERL